MKSVLFTGMLLVSSMAFAKTHFEDLLEKFEMGTALDPSQLEGAYVGRCFYGFELTPGLTPDSAKSSLIVGKSFTKNTGDNAGPLYPPKTEIRLIVNLFSAYKGQDYNFDKLTEKQAMAALHRDNGVKSTPVISDGKSLTWTSTYQNGPTGKFEARNYGGFITVKSTLVKDVPDTPANAGDNFANCYFYEKLK